MTAPDHSRDTLVRLTTGLGAASRSPQFDSLRELLSAAAPRAASTESPPNPLEDVAFAATAAGAAIRRVDPADVAVDIGMYSNPLRGMAPTRTIGPFLDRAGGRVRFEVYEPAHAIRIASGGAVLFALSAARFPKHRPTTGAVTLDVQPGSAWIEAALVAPGSPAGFIGARVRDGKLTIPAGSVESANGRIDIGVLPTCSLTLEFEPAVPPALGANACAAATGTTITAPARLRIEIEHGAVHSVAVGSGSATAYGQHYAFHDHRGRGRYVPAIASIVFDARVAPSSFDPSSIASPLIAGSGTAAITEAGWAIPLTQVSADALGVAAGSGGWALALGPGIAARVVANDPDPLALGSAWIVISAGSFTLKAVSAPAGTAVRTLTLWALASAGDRPLPLAIRHPPGTQLVYSCSADGERVLATGMCKLAIDQPVEISGQPIEVADGAVLLAIVAQGGSQHITVYGVPGTGPSSPSSHKPARDALLALRNALLWVSPPALYIIVGELSDGGRIATGAAAVLFRLRRWAPILPDPYVASFALLRDREPGAGGAGTLIAELTWTAGGPAMLEFLGALPAPAVAELPGSPPGTRPHPADPYDVATPTAPRGSLGSSDHPAHGVAVLVESHAETSAAEARAAGAVALPRAGIRLLDVSTRKDLIGIEWSKVDPGTVGVSAGGQAAAGAAMLARMDVHLPLVAQRVFMLPQVQWEPVRTLPEDQDPIVLGSFPTPLASASDGGATRLAAASPTLVPAIPDLVVDGVLDAFADGAQTAFATTLPFGIQTLVRLRPTASGGLLRDTMHRTEPVFAAPAVRGGAQITALAEGGRRKPGDESAGFQGLTVQRRNGVDLATGAPLNISVLGSTLDPAGSVESIFNSEFTTTAPRVPITRFDLSGYGGSNFSDWQNPFGAFAQTTKVQFKVVVGRAFWEMVKVATVLYPWGIHVTRSITIERTAGAGVIRKDSGWVASSDGLFDFRYKPNAATPLQPSPYTVHPGLIRGLFGVTRIRPTNGPEIAFPGSSGTVRMSPYYFDADLALEGGATTRAIGLLGFLQLAPSGRPLDTTELGRLFELQGAIGGPIEHTLDVGGSGLAFRATRVEADRAIEGGDLRLVGVLRGSVGFPAVGSWATVRLPGPANATAPREPVPVDSVRGAPLVRQQRMLDPVSGAMRLAAAAGNYRFADAADLFAAGNPAWDYAFLESNAACSFLFRRPHIAHGVAEIASTTTASFADVISRTTSKAVYPPLENAIDFPSPAHKLRLVPGGFALDPPANFTPSRPDLALAQEGANEIRLTYGSATVRYGLDATGWSLHLTRLRSEADMLGMTAFSATEYDIIGSASDRPVISRAQNFLFPEFEDALDFIPGFTQHPNFGPIDLAPSNLDHEIKVNLRAEYEKEFGIVTIGCHVGSWVGWEIDSTTGITVPATGLELGAELEVKIPLEPPWFMVLGLELAATLKQLATTSALSTEIEVDAFVGFGAEIKIGPFGGEAYLAVGVVVIWDDGIWKVGGLVKLHAELDLGICSVSLDAELKGVVYCETPDRKCDYSGEVEVNVSICWVFHIDATYEASDTAIIGSC
jgi:hypothetical protein